MNAEAMGVEGGGTAVLDSPETPDLPGPGLYPGMPMEDYLALPYMSSSRLEKMRRSPLQFRHSLEAEPETTDALERGTALHMAVLEPDLFEGHYVTIGQCEGVKGDGERCQYQGSVYRDGQSFCKTHDPAKGEPLAPGLTVLKADLYESVLGMRDAVLAHPRARTLFEGAGLFEATVIFDDPETGVRCRIRPDRLVRRAGMMVEVKTTRDAAPWKFPADAERLGYFRKLALYRRGLRAIGWPYSHIAVLALEPSPPFDLLPYLADEDDLDRADREITRLLGRYQDCTQDDHFPGYAEEFQTLRRPAWATKDEED